MIRFIYKILKFYGEPYECNICSTRVRRFFPFSNDLQESAKKSNFAYGFDRMETLNLENCNCPFCLSSDRERLYALFLDKYFSENPHSVFKMLDFAPNLAFSSYFKSKKNVRYQSADLFRTDMDLQIDVCHMYAVQDETYEIVICSHVLEHVKAPARAMNELFRVLKNGGLAIIMVPLFQDVEHTIEDSSHVTDEERTHYYGQYDHVRLYARKDFLGQIKQAGFSLKEYTTKDFDGSAIQKHAIALNSVLYVGYK